MLGIYFEHMDTGFLGVDLEHFAVCNLTWKAAFSGMEGKLPCILVKLKDPIYLMLRGINF